VVSTDLPVLFSENVTSASRVSPWHAHREPTQERERIHVHRERPIVVGALERDPKKPIGLSFQALLRQRGTKDIAKQSLTPDDIERTRLGSPRGA
jgi:hypothetical protein